MAFKTGLLWAVGALAVLPVVLPLDAAAQQWRREPVTVGPSGGRAALAVVDLRGGGQMQVLCQGEDFSVSVRLPFRIEDAETAAVTLTVPGQSPEVQQWQVGAEGRSIASSAPAELARHLIAGRAPAVALAASRGRVRSIAVPVGPSAALIAGVMETCGQNPADIMALVPGIDPQLIAYLDQVSNFEGYKLRSDFLGEQRLETVSPRPTQLYESLAAFWRETLPGLCLDPVGDYRIMPSCEAVRAARARDAAAPIPVSPGQVIEDYRQRRIDLAMAAAASNRLASAERNSCGRPDTPARAVSDFRAGRAFPAIALEQNIGGVVLARISLDAAGAITGIEFVSVHPAGIFEDAVEREIRAMTFEPATRNCQPVPGSYELSVSFSFAS